MNKTYLYYNISKNVAADFVFVSKIIKMYKQND